jgi:glucose-1-phosphate thymidylyltransferase
LGINIEYLIEERPRGIAPALTIARDFLDGGPACLILSDNIFIGPQMGELVTRTKNNLSYGEAAIFSVPVENPERFGVAETDEDGRVVSLIEKPQHPKSNQAVVGLYMYDGQAPEIAAKAPLSDRGEAEITWVNNYYRENHTLSLTKLGDDIAWHDAGTPDSMLAAGLAVKAAQLRDSHYNPGCLEDIALKQGWMTPADLAKRLANMPDTRYAQNVLNRQDQLAD